MPDLHILARRTTAILILCTLCTLAVQGASAQSSNADASDEGFWIGGGFGPAYAWMDCSECRTLTSSSPWEGGQGLGFEIAAGGMPRDRIRLGGEIAGWSWGTEGPSNERITASIVSLSFVGQFYPYWDLDDTYLFGGIGFASSLHRRKSDGIVTELVGAGWSLEGGIGFDFALTDALTLSPRVTYVQTIMDGDEIAGTEPPSVGPNDPRFLRVGLGLVWY